MDSVPNQDEASTQEDSSSKQEIDPEVTFNPPQAFPNMLVPYIEGPKMDCIMNDGLYSRMLKLKLKCKNILECELAMLAEKRKCKKIIAWSGDIGIDQYVSQNLTNEELALYVIWEKFEEFCKPQSNEVRERFDLLTSFTQGERSVDKWYNVVQTQIALAKYPQETAKILHRYIFWFFLRDEESVSKTIHDNNIDLNKFLQVRCTSLPRKWKVLKP